MSHQVAKLIARIAENLPEMNKNVMQDWIDNPKSLQRFLTGLCPPTKCKVDWRKAYDILGMLAEYDSEIAILAISEQDGLWTIPVIKGVTCNKVVAGLKMTDVKVWTYKNDLDKDVIVNDRDPNRDGSYAISFHSNVEADKENKNQSAEQRREQGCKDITLLERFLLELGYFLTTAKHLDIRNWTLCSGSRDSDCGVPCAGWEDDEFSVDWSGSDCRHDYLRARSVVSLPV